MLRQLIDLLADSHTGLGVEDLARRLDTSTAAVEGALDLLVRKGRLIKGGPRSGACDGCAAVTLCNPLQGCTTRYFIAPGGVRLIFPDDKAHPDAAQP